MEKDNIYLIPRFQNKKHKFHIPWLYKISHSSC